MLSRFFSGDNILFKIFSVLWLLCVEFWMWLALPYVWALLVSLLLGRVFKPFMEEQRKEQAGM